ncbi:hypothetical protein IJD44_08290 [bacterium]|nr:hypothetical protein [bacterium]
MKVSSIGNQYTKAFGATLARKVTNEDINSYYNPQIAAIKAKRDPLLQLNDYLDSKPVQKALSKLPKEDELFVDCRDFDVNKTFLLYSPVDKDRFKKLETLPVPKAVNTVSYDIKMKDGQLDTESLSAWLNNLVKFFTK